MLSNQEAFTKVVSHLRKQGKKAVEFGSCKYRASGGRSCAIGCLIPDEKYRPNMEGLGTKSLLERFSDLQEFLPEADFCIELQTIHDHNSPTTWESLFKHVATQHNLTLEPL